MKSAKSTTAKQYKHAKTDEERKARIKQNKARYKASPKGQYAARKDTLRCYGITPEDWEGMFYRQGFSCDICGVHDLDYNNEWHTDHCHATGRVRGILCNTCNKGLGLFRDNSHTLALAIHYLEKQ